MGVQRAMNMVLDASNQREEHVYTYGPLIHNPKTVELLEKKGVKVVEDVEELTCGTLLIRAHGVPPQLRKKIKASGARVWDATCPRVGGVQSTIKKHIRKGYTPIIVGDAGHPEVVGLMGYSDGRGLVINSLEEVDALSPLERVVVVAQTTQDEEKYNRIVKQIKDRYGDVISFNTICESTHLRQEEVRRMAQKVDAVVVVGGKNSGNTRRLAEIAEGYGVPTYHVESEEELAPELFSKAGTVGVTAGASTPDWTIRRVAEKLYNMEGRDRRPLTRSIRNLLNFLSRSGILSSISALGLFLAAAVLAGGEVSPLLMLASAFFVFSQQTFHSLSEVERISFTSSIKGDFLKKRRALLSLSAVAASLTALILSLRIGMVPFIMVTSAFGLGMGHYLRRPGSDGKTRKGAGTKGVRKTGGREITLSLSWALALAAAPLAAGSSPLLSSLFAAAIVFLVAFARVNLIALREIQADKMLGVRTISVRLGGQKGAALISGLIIALGALTAGGALAGIFSAWGYLFAVLPVYFAVLMKLRKGDALYPEENFLAAVDASMLLYLVVALLCYRAL